MIESKMKKGQSNTVLSEIKHLRGMTDFMIDQRNSNRYRVIIKEKTGKTAYCFSTPIYSAKTKKLIHMNFEKTEYGYSFKGSNSIISVCENRCVLENNEGRIIVSLKDIPAIYGSQESIQSAIMLMPTLNGLRFVVRGQCLKILLKSKAKQIGIRFNQTCFSIMKETFRPFLSVATLYASDEKGAFSPVEMKYQDKGSQTYELEMFHELSDGAFEFEINLYESKLFQDTTVASRFPDENNAYGAIGFIGKTEQFGEQWLYSRPDFSQIPDFSSEQVERLLLHIPVLNGSLENLEVFVPVKRFCSFGSTWNRKVKSSEKVSSSNNYGRYITVDVTSLFTNQSEHTLIYSEGLIMKKPKGKDDFIAISTGDCYSAPQILEIKFRN